MECWWFVCSGNGGVKLDFMLVVSRYLNFSRSPISASTALLSDGAGRNTEHRDRRNYNRKTSRSNFQ